MPGPRRGRLGWLRPRRRGQGTARHCLWSPEPLSSWPWSSRPWTTTPLGQPRSDRCFGGKPIANCCFDHCIAKEHSLSHTTPHGRPSSHRRLRGKPIANCCFDHCIAKEHSLSHTTPHGWPSSDRASQESPLQTAAFITLIKGTQPQPDHARRSAKLRPTPAGQANCKLLF